MIRKFLYLGAGLLASLAILAACGWAYVASLELGSIVKPDPSITVAELAWLQQARPAPRGKILAVVTSTEHINGAKAGYELTELARAYYVFHANGFEVDIASPSGGKPHAVIDKDDMAETDYAFLNDAAAQAKVNQSLALASVDAQAYAGVYFVGGKGALFDLPGNPDIARIVNQIARRGVVGAVCHGPAALLGVNQADGTPLVAGRRMTGFTNDEELFLMEDARMIFPFLLQDKAQQLGANFVAARSYLENTVVDGRLVTGQNPWSTWRVAEEMVRVLGYQPIARPVTAEENSLQLLASYYRVGLEQTRTEQAQMARFDKMLLLMHALVAGMQWRPYDAYQLQRLAKG